MYTILLYYFCLCFFLLCSLSVFFLGSSAYPYVLHDYLTKSFFYLIEKRYPIELQSKKHQNAHNFSPVGSVFVNYGNAYKMMRMKILETLWRLIHRYSVLFYIVSVFLLYIFLPKSTKNNIICMSWLLLASSHLQIWHEMCTCPFARALLLFNNNQFISVSPSSPFISVRLY